MPFSDKKANGMTFHGRRGNFLAAMGAEQGTSERPAAIIGSIYFFRFR
jgi:hypothetical protein